jgi:hypothetical protein
MVSFLVIRHFELDVIASLLTAYSPGQFFASSIGTEALTALVVAGGSAGVQNIMTALGYRTKTDIADTQPKPKPDEAWIAVNLTRKSAVGPVSIALTQVEDATGSVPSIAGTATNRRRSILSLMLRNTDRFPANGGYAVVPDTVYRAQAIGTDKAGNRIECELGVDTFRLSPGAFVDFEATL